MLAAKAVGGLDVMRRAKDLSNMCAQGHNGKVGDKQNKCKRTGAKNFTYKYKKFFKNFPGKKFGLLLR